MKYKFIEDLEFLLTVKDPTWLEQLDKEGRLTPNKIGLGLTEKFPDCPVGLRNYRDGATIAWLRTHYDQAQD